MRSPSVPIVCCENRTHAPGGHTDFSAPRWRTPADDQPARGSLRPCGPMGLGIGGPDGPRRFALTLPFRHCERMRRGLQKRDAQVGQPILWAPHGPPEFSTSAASVHCNREHAEARTVAFTLAVNRCQPLSGRAKLQINTEALVAQGIEHRFPKPCVAGSNPAEGATITAGQRPTRHPSTASGTTPRPRRPRDSRSRPVRPRRCAPRPRRVRRRTGGRSGRA